MRRAATLATAGLLVFLAAWLLRHPALPHVPTSDLYDHLCVTRNLVQGEGFTNDIVYPVSLAFPFAASVPQPLIHRPPAYSLLLLLPYAVGGGEPQTVLNAVRWMLVLVLAATVWLGIRNLLQRNLAEAIPAWLVAMLASPLLAMSVGWGRVEVPTALVLMWLWCRWRAGLLPVASARGISGTATGAATDGALAATLTLLRPELAWVLLLWWLAARPDHLVGPEGAGSRPAATRWCLTAILVWLLLILPWAARNVMVTGQPFFALQSYTEHLKATSAWPGYSIYRSLSPESLLTTLSQHPGLLVAKAGSGLRFFATNLGRWLPWLAWGIWLLLLFHGWRRPSRQGEVRRWWYRWRRPLVLPFLTAGLLMIQYAIFSHTLRHLAVVLPIVLLELWGAGAAWLSGIWPRGRPIWRGGILMAVCLAAFWLTPPRLPGWERSRDEAAIADPLVKRAAERVTELPPGPLITDTAALLWLIDRPGMWWPLDEEITGRIAELVPALASAPVVRVLGGSTPATGETREGN